MFVQRDLSWMAGFPVAAGDWLSLELGRPVSKRRLDGELLHRSTLAIRRLVRGFPEALPQLVGDVESWAGCRLALVEALKPAVHRQRPLPPEPLACHPEARESLLRLARRARRDAPRLARLVTALSWLCWTDLSALRPALRWLLEHRQALEPLQAAPGVELPLAVRLWQLRHAHGERRVAPCLDWLSRPGLFAYPTECPHEFGHRAAAFFERPRKRPPERPEPGLGAGLIAWIEEQAGRDAATRKRALELLPVLLQGERQTEWQRWWRRAEGLLERARVLHRSRRDRPPPVLRQKRVRGELKSLDSTRPPSLPAGRVLSLLSGLPSADHLQLYRAIVPQLRRWPALADGVAVRLAFAGHWLDLARRRDPPEQTAVRRLIRALCGYWRAQRFRPDALEPWAPVWRPGRGQRSYFDLDRHLLQELRQRDRLKRFFEVLSSARPPVSTAESELLVSLVAKLPAGRVADAFSRLRDSPLASGYLPDELIALAGRLTSCDQDRFLPVLRALNKHHEGRPASAQTLRPVARALEAIGRPRVASRCIEAGHLGLLTEVGQKLRFVTDHERDPPRPELLPAAASRAWTERYPSQLKPALRELARCDDRAERTAGRLLGKDLPAPAALRREIAALRRGTSSDPAQKIRLRNLEARLEAEPRVSPGRLANLEAKLATSSARTLVERWSRALSRAYDRALLRFLDVATPPPWSRRDDVRRALRAVPELGPGFRKLARRLFRRRCAAPPWDLREDPANAAFLARMSELGIDVGLWIDGPQRRWVETGGGEKIELALERDPLEVLHMGEPFRTCLAPGNFNFFSAFANACDVNKQVLYGRDAHGAVVARALLALTAEGGLLCFYPYCLAGDIDFAAQAQAYARRLAKAMGTLVVASGDVPRLVATDWWDDGPTDPSAQHPALEEGSALRLALAELPPERLAAAIREAFAPLALSELTLPLVLQLPELDARPELASGVTWLAGELELPTDALLRLGRLLLAAGDVGQGRTLAPLLAARVVTGFREVEYLQLEAVELLAELDPSRALRLLRQTRARGVRRWEQEASVRRLILGAEASRRLGRRKQARTLLELARDVAPDQAGRAECDRLLAALD